MRNPFEASNKGNTRKLLLGLDSWLDDTLYRLFADAGSWWESVTIFFRRFRVSGFTKFLVEIADEAVTLSLAGGIVLFTLAQPAIEVSKRDWRGQAEFAVTFLDRYGNEIGQRGIRQTDSEEIDELPDHFIKAVLATEDRRFFEHWGIDLFGLSRAMLENVRANSVVQGGSTVTQQLAKNLFLTNERTIARKVKEAFLAMWLETNVSKKEILKLYLDRAYMGGGNFGVAAAAQYYFDKKASELTLAESAMLAGLYKAPTKYAPHINLPAARARANEVLTNMVEAGFMTEGQVINARRNPASIVERNDEEGPNYFMDYAFEQLKQKALRYPTRSFVAKTTVDLDLQKAAEEAVQASIRQFGQRYGAKQAAMVVIDHDGAIRAMVGGVDYGASQFNRATSSRRQPGSSFKPFVYASAMDNFGYDGDTRVVDGPVSTGRWSPRNYSGGFRGAMDITTALVKSYNTIPAKLYLGRDGLEPLGGKRIEETVRKLGINSPLVLNPPMVLGSNGLTALEMATGYGAFMTGGYRLDSHALLQIQDSQGSVLFDYREDRAEPERVLKQSTVESMNKIMVQIPEWGTGRRAALDGIRAAGKTGTTSAYRDAWFVGFTGNYVASVWFGNDDYTSTRRMTGGSVPAMTWKNFMTFAHQNIDLRPVPFVEDPLPGGEVVQPENVASGEDGNAGPILRPKVLSEDAAALLRRLEETLRDAEPVSANPVLALGRGDENPEQASQ